MAGQQAGYIVRIAIVVCLAMAVFFAVLAKANAGDTARPLMQINPWYPAPYNIEEPYLDIIHASSVSWHAQDVTTQELYDQGVLDPKTGLPVRLADGKWLSSGPYFTAANTETALLWDGEWVLEWEGDAVLRINGVPNDMQWRSTPNRIDFTIDATRGKTRPASIEVRKVKTPINALRLFRKDNEALLPAQRWCDPSMNCLT